VFRRRSVACGHSVCGWGFPVVLLDRSQHESNIIQNKFTFCASPTDVGDAPVRVHVGLKCRVSSRHASVVVVVRLSASRKIKWVNKKTYLLHVPNIRWGRAGTGLRSPIGCRFRVRVRLWGIVSGRGRNGVGGVPCARLRRRPRRSSGTSSSWLSFAVVVALPFLLVRRRRRRPAVRGWMWFGVVSTTAVGGAVGSRYLEENSQHKKKDIITYF